MDEWKPENELPQGVIFDESSRLKGDTSQRTQAAPAIGGLDPRAVRLRGLRDRDERYARRRSRLSTGGVSARSLGQASCGKAAARHWNSAAVSSSCSSTTLACFPSGSAGKMTRASASTAALLEAEGPHELDGIIDPDEFHPFESSTNEVAYMYEPSRASSSSSTRRIASPYPTSDTARSSAGLIPACCGWPRRSWTPCSEHDHWPDLLRELSDGFQYRDVEDGEVRCPHCPRQLRRDRGMV